MEKVQAVLDVSFASIIKFFIILFLAIILYFSAEIFIWIFLALIIAVLLNPFVDFLELKKIPRVIGTGIVYTILIVAMVLMIALTVPTIVREVINIVPQMPEIGEVLKNIQIGGQPLLGFLPRLANGYEFGETIRMATDILFTFFRGLVAFGVIFFLSLFFCIEKKKIKNFISFLFPKKKEIIKYTLDTSQRKIHLWFVVRIINCLFMAVAMYIILLFAGVSSPLSIASLIGILSFIPLFGAIFISILLLSFISIVHTLYLAIIIFLVYLVVNLIADNILTPTLSKKVLNISPALILIAVVVGNHLYGPLGAILSIPVFAIVLEFIETYIKETRTEKIDDKKKRVIIV